MKGVTAVAICILTRDDVLAAFLLTECMGDVRRVSDKKSVSRGEVCIVDAETVMPPYPVGTVFVIARKETELPAGARLLLRPLAVGSVRAALSQMSLTLVHEARSVTALGVTVTLSAPEWKLFEALYGACGRVVSRVQLLATLESEAEDKDALLTVYMYRLRRALAPLGFGLRTLRGEGYLLTLRTGGSSVC